MERPRGRGWTYIIIHSFANSNGYGGPFYSRLAIDAQGNLYGTTFASTDNGPGNGMGFELSPPMQGGTWFDPPDPSPKVCNTVKLPVASSLNTVPAPALPPPFLATERNFRRIMGWKDVWQLEAILGRK